MKINSILMLAGAFFVTCTATARADCDRPSLRNQRHDVETIQRLERAWSAAFETGDTEYESCLLTEDFVEIRSDGKIHKLEDELALAAKHKGEKATDPSGPAPQVHLHGDVAVAYGLSPSAKMVDGKPYKSYYADYYFWKDGGWHVYFAEQTSFQVTADVTSPAK